MVPKEVKLGHEHEQALSPIFSDLLMIYWDSFKGLTHPYESMTKFARRLPIVIFVMPKLHL